MQKSEKKNKSSTKSSTVQENLGTVDLYKEDFENTFEFKESFYTCFVLKLDRFQELANVQSVFTNTMKIFFRLKCKAMAAGGLNIQD